MERTNKIYVSNDNFNQIILDEKNIDINQKLNTFLHSNIKEIIGIRSYLYHFQNIIFTALNKNSLAIIGTDVNNITNICEKYNFQICKIVRETWKNSNIKIKYFYIKDGRLQEITFESNFIEKPNSQTIEFSSNKANYTFENFISSEENNTALEICQSIACYSNKELVYGGSVVFLHGEGSTGKTHLVNAITNFYSEKGGKVYTTNANTFLRQYIDAVQKQNVFNFQDNILQNEVIIFDDIDDLIGKVGTLSEMQKLITTAIESRKYVVLTSKISPNILSEKNNCFKNILSNAISIKLQKQQDALKTQIAIQYIYENNMNVPISIIRDLVVTLDCNVRELKNYIKKLAIVQSIRKFELNTSLALEILSDDVNKKDVGKIKKQFSNEEIIDIVANYYHLSSKDISSKIKRESVCRARNVAIFFMRKINSANFQEIGQILNRNHSTIIAGLKNIDLWIQNDKALPSELADISAMLK